MNDVYFACRTCKRFVDAGYRWAYATLELSNVVQHGQQLEVDAVFSATEYWNGAQQPRGLALYSRTHMPSSTPIKGTSSSLARRKTSSRLIHLNFWIGLKMPISQLGHHVTSQNGSTSHTGARSSSICTSIQLSYRGGGGALSCESLAGRDLNNSF